MKLRIYGDSIRLRLKINEVSRIATGESIVETTRLPDSVLIYSLEVSETDGFSATFSDGKLRDCVDDEDTFPHPSAQ
jgi:hypothetical protein